MTLVHNVIIRGYNSVYLQAPKIKDTDVTDFLQYCMAFYNIVESHHAGEEEVLFPNIEKASGVKGVMDEEFEEHRQYPSMNPDKNRQLERSFRSTDTRRDIQTPLICLD